MYLWLIWLLMGLLISVLVVIVVRNMNRWICVVCIDRWNLLIR